MDIKHIEKNKKNKNKNKNRKIEIFDTTLRDGAQMKGISFTVDDKLKIVRCLDEFGIDYVEAGNPGSNLKDIEFFVMAGKANYKSVKLAAFGSTHRAGVNVCDDPYIRSLISTGLKNIVIFGKCWDFHVKEVLKATNAENLEMIGETVDCIIKSGSEVIFDGEHFFNGYTSNPSYAIKCLEAAYEAGARKICLCDTNGGSFPELVRLVVGKVVSLFDNRAMIGIHCHNDCGMAVANSIVAVEAGAAQVQGTVNGYGERCGNANLSSVIPNLQLKLGYDCIPDENMQNISYVSRFISEIANIPLNEGSPYVGGRAFTHKGGMHIDAVEKNPATFEHIDPNMVGNARHNLMSEVSGRSAFIKMVQKIDSTINKDSPILVKVVDRLKELEYKGYQYEAAESSFELEAMKILGKYAPSFELTEFKVIVNEPSVCNVDSVAIIKIKVNGEEEISAGEGNGPVNALDKAIRKAMKRFYPELEKMKLTDYKVRVLDSNAATEARVRVLIESTDGVETWTTIGVSTNIIQASWKALVDSIEYMLGKGSRNGLK
ncbi:MAG: citramalate synthase [Oscillospiraceae bacterium]|nr:citramalate synthase [Oscillospiraceae bacterium]